MHVFSRGLTFTDFAQFRRVVASNAHARSIRALAVSEDGTLVFSAG